LELASLLSNIYEKEEVERREIKVKSSHQFMSDATRASIDHVTRFTRHFQHHSSFPSFLSLTSYLVYTYYAIPIYANSPSSWYTSLFTSESTYFVFTTHVNIFWDEATILSNTYDSTQDALYAT
jgi:hypothetical protein